MKTILIGLSIVIMTASLTYAGGKTPEFSIGARNVSLANANISESSDVSAMYENPAAIGFLENSSIFINHSQEYGPGGMEEDIAIPLVLKSPVVFAVGLDSYHFGYLSQTSPASQRVFEYGYDMAFASTITPTVSIGGSASLRHGTTGTGSQAWGAYFSVGADYAPTPDLSYSIVLGGLGRDVSYFAGDSGMAATGQLLPRTLEIGATMTYPSSASLLPPLFILSFANEKIFGVGGVYYKGGIEIRPVQFIALRFGYMAGPNLASARYGLGFIGKFFSLQYAVYPSPETHALLQQFSLSMEF